LACVNSRYNSGFRKKVVLGKFTLTVDIYGLQYQTYIENETSSLKISCEHKLKISNFIFSTMRTGVNVRFTLKLLHHGDSKFAEDVITNTSVRLSTIPNPLKRRRSTDSFDDIRILLLDQFHVLSKFQGQGYGTMLIAIIITWLSKTYPDIKKIVVISPSSAGRPFYLALGAQKLTCSPNFEFVIE